MYNLQGDVPHILNSAGGVVGTYEYDAWGNITNLSSLTSIARQNPFRYRGYYYDTESGLYYLNSRYYNPEWGRFLNADSGIYSVGDTVHGYNLFAYCNDNPIMCCDPNGTFSMSALMTTLHAITYVTSEAADYIETEKKKEENINTLKSTYETTVTTLVDDLCNFIAPAKSALTKPNTTIGKSIVFATDKIGLASILTTGISIVWDYNAYGLSEEFVASVCTTISFVCIGTIVGSLIAATSLAPTTILVATIATGVIISDLEDKFRQLIF